MIQLLKIHQKVVREVLSTLVGAKSLDGPLPSLIHLGLEFFELVNGLRLLTY